jgi:hypothetical protein
MYPNVRLRLICLCDERGVPLKDVDSESASHEVFLVLYREFKAAKQQGRRVHFSIAGGRKTFAAYGIEVLFHDDGLRRIAELAEQEETGARGLMTVCERVFREFKYELPSTHVKRFVVTREVVDDPPAALQRLLEQHDLEERDVMRRLVHDFAAKFTKEHGLKLTFTAAAADRLVALAQEDGAPVREFCARRFKDFQFGLKLVAQNTNRRVFELDEAAVEAPDKVLSEWVVASYRESGETPPSDAPAEKPAADAPPPSPKTAAEPSATPDTAADEQSA